jgi:hypothetical protein
MSRSVYKYDLEDLSEAASGLATLKSDFEQASAVREEANDAFGYSDVQGAVQDFVDNWKHNRERQLETLTSAQEALSGIRETYVAMDAEGVNQLQDSGSGDNPGGPV